MTTTTRPAIPEWLNPDVVPNDLIGQIAEAQAAATQINDAIVEWVANHGHIFGAFDAATRGRPSSRGRSRHDQHRLDALAMSSSRHASERT